MSDLGSSFDPQIGRPANRPPGASWHNSVRLFGSSFLRSRRAKQWALLGLPILLVLPIAIAIVWYGVRPSLPFRKAPQMEASSRVNSLLQANVSKPKPSPAKPFEAPPRPTVSTLPMTSAPSVEPNQPASTMIPVPGQSMAGTVKPAPIAPNTPGAPAVSTARAPFSPLVYRAKHDKAFGAGCSGQLTLSSSALLFNCPDDSHASMQIALSEIGAVDENGVRLFSGKKYHFSIPGMTKSGEEALFANWLHQVR